MSAPTQLPLLDPPSSADQAGSKPKATLKNKLRPKRSQPQQPSLLSPNLPKPIAPPIAQLPVEQSPALPAPKARPENAPEGWVDPDDPDFNAIKNCYQCGCLIKTGGLDHSLCSSSCGWVVDRVWKQRQDELAATRKLRRSSTVEAQAATHTDCVESHEIECLDLFANGLDTSEIGGEP